MNSGSPDARVFIRDTVGQRPKDAATLVAEIPGVQSAILGEDGIYVVRFDRTAVSPDALVASLDREGLQVVRWDVMQGEGDAEREADVASRDHPEADPPPAPESAAVTLRGGPFDGQARRVSLEALRVDEPLMIEDGDGGSHPDIPGVVGAVEYLYRGDGRADYVGGLPDDSTPHGQTP